VETVFAFLGLLKEGSEKFAIFVTKRSVVGRICGAEILRVDEVQAFPLSHDKTVPDIVG
jgi:hypothetical protein